MFPWQTHPQQVIILQWAVHLFTHLQLINIPPVSEQFSGGHCFSIGQVYKQVIDWWKKLQNTMTLEILVAFIHSIVCCWSAYLQWTIISLKIHYLWVNKSLVNGGNFMTLTLLSLGERYFASPSHIWLLLSPLTVCIIHLLCPNTRKMCSV